MSAPAPSPRQIELPQDDLLALESMGLMERTRAPAFLVAGGQVFRATEAGKAVALRELEPPHG